MLFVSLVIVDTTAVPAVWILSVNSILVLSNHGMTLRSLNKGPDGVSHFLSRITLAHRF